MSGDPRHFFPRSVFLRRYRYLRTLGVSRREAVPLAIRFAWAMKGDTP